MKYWSVFALRSGLHYTSRLENSQYKDTPHPGELIIWKSDKKLWTETQGHPAVRNSGVFLLSTLEADLMKKWGFGISLLLFDAVLLKCISAKHRVKNYRGEWREFIKLVILVWDERHESQWWKGYKPQGGWWHVCFVVVSKLGWICFWHLCGLNVSLRWAWWGKMAFE